MDILSKDIFQHEIHLKSSVEPFSSLQCSLFFDILSKVFATMFVMKKSVLAYLSLLVIAFFPLSAEAIETVDPTNFTEYLHDPKSSLQVESLGTPENSTRFAPISQSKLNFGYSSSTHWLRLSPPPGEWLLEVGSPLLDQITLYRPLKDGGFDITRAGDSISFAEQEIPYHIPVFKISQSGKSTFYLQVQSSGSTQISLRILSPENFLISAIKVRQVAGIYLGAMLVMVIYNLFVFFSTRDKNYLFYIFYISVFILFQSSLSGYAQQYLWPEYPAWSTKANAFLVGLVVLAALQFSRNFLRTWQQVPRLDILMKGLIVGGAMCMILAFIAPYIWVAFFSNLLGLGLVVAVLSAGYLTLFQGYRPARFFVLAWTIFLLGILSQGLLQAGVLPLNIFTENSMPIGSMVEVVLLSLALADRINNLRFEKDLAQERFNNQLQRLNQTLELQVSKRTEELLAAKEHAEEVSDNLVEKNIELNFLASNDVLTGVLNRRVFREQAEFMMADAKRYQYSISLMMVDIDNFKKVNDRYGHQAGDMVLKDIGQLLKQNMRQSDRVARYGGEEFIVLLSHTSEKDAIAKAEHLRESLLTLRFDFEKKLIVSASFGLASTQHGDVELDELIYKADKALYDAKRLGRNQVTFVV